MALSRKCTLPTYKHSVWDNQISARGTHRVKVNNETSVHILNSVAGNQLACCSNTNVFKFPIMNEENNSVLKGNRTTYQTCPLNRNYRSLSRQRVHTSVTSLSFIVLSLAFLSMSQFSLVAADELNSSDTVIELTPVGGSNNHSSGRSSSYGTGTSQSSSTALRKAYTNQFAVGSPVVISWKRTN
ncbi:hypothetical protein WUBG_03436 [Wuchereria bancrofti]|uniref:Uncharacterized protein n=1 Tax=Wuchereria bancrofti TaxID=6293 RepID=J9FE71_WUCBA|nr:hypothetical protein WUBG_03436 [Wuchereria bancrofti]